MDVLKETYAIVIAAHSMQQAARNPAYVTGRIG
jgi:ABC-type phosphate transport system ATPase subunit